MLHGTSGSDRLSGGAGADLTAGGGGNDAHYVDHAGDRVAEFVGEGTDTVFSTVSYALAAGQEVESLRVLGAAGLTLTGNELGNRLRGSSGIDTLNGGGGDDRMAGRGGADITAEASGTMSTTSTTRAIRSSRPRAKGSTRSAAPSTTPSRPARRSSICGPTRRRA